MVELQEIAKKQQQNFMSIECYKFSSISLRYFLHLCVCVCVSQQFPSCASYVLCLLRKQEVQVFTAGASSSVLNLEKKYYQNEAADALVHRSASQIDAAEF